MILEVFSNLNDSMIVFSLCSLAGRGGLGLHRETKGANDLEGTVRAGWESGKSEMVLLLGIVG